VGCGSASNVLTAVMTRRSPLTIILIAIAVLLVVNVLLSRAMPHMALSGWIADVLVVGAIGYIVGAIALSRGFRLPSLPRRRRVRVVRRDPSKDASDFIKQFEKRRKR
jgi:hypothetical protein